MASADDVVTAIIDAQGPVDPLRLQKLLYYAQAWHLAWYDEPLFDEPIEAWSYGPVVPSICRQYKAQGRQPITATVAGTATALDDRQMRAICAVVSAYGSLTGPELVRMTHAEAPWREARSDTNGEDGDAVIGHGAMRAFYAEQGVLGGHRSATVDVDEALRNRVMAGDGAALADLFEQCLGVSVASVSGTPN